MPPPSAACCAARSWSSWASAWWCWRCPRCWSGPRRPGRPRPSRSTSPCRCSPRPARRLACRSRWTPRRPGANLLHVYLFDESGQLSQPEDIRVTLTEPAQEIGPLTVDLEPAGPGHYVGDGVAIPTAGTWTLAVSVRLDEFTATTASTEFPVR